MSIEITEDMPPEPPEANSTSDAYLDELLKRAEDAEHSARDLAIYNLYLAADRARRNLEDYRSHVENLDARAVNALRALGALIHAQSPQARSGKLYKAVEAIWREAAW